MAKARPGQNSYSPTADELATVIKSLAASYCLYWTERAPTIGSLMPSFREWLEYEYGDRYPDDDARKRMFDALKEAAMPVVLRMLRDADS